MTLYCYIQDAVVNLCVVIKVVLCVKKSWGTFLCLLLISISFLCPFIVLPTLYKHLFTISTNICSLFPRRFIHYFYKHQLGSFTNYFFSWLHEVLFAVFCIQLFAILQSYCVFTNSYSLSLHSSLIFAKTYCCLCKILVSSQTTNGCL